jgi:UDP-N-acetylmuramate--alanine ligase
MKYHLIGDQGVSMRGIKKYLQHQGHIVTGSDLKTGGHRKENITDDIDLVVRTSAANNSSEAIVELEEAKRKGIKIVKRSEILRNITAGKNLIAISGMHGKTTVTTMVGTMLVNAGLDPTVFVGADVKDFEGVVRIGQSDLFVMEACEYDRAFLDFFPTVLILTNIEAEHLDTYPGGLPEIKETFIEYINHVPDNGVIIACADDENVKDVLGKVKTKAEIIPYGFSAEKYNKLDFKLAVPGKHNILNALSVCALGDHMGVSAAVIEKTLKNFHNASRRFELLGQYNGADLIDDYGHHPTEIKAAIASLKERYPEKKRIVMFWPHQYKRIKPLLDDFAKSFADADEVIIKPIYYVPGRDEILDVSSHDLVEKINDYSKNAKFFATDEEIVNYLVKVLDEHSVLMTIGIPPAYEVARKILKETND